VYIRLKAFWTAIPKQMNAIYNLCNVNQDIALFRQNCTCKYMFNHVNLHFWTDIGVEKSLKWQFFNTTKYFPLKPKVEMKTDFPEFLKDPKLFQRIAAVYSDMHISGTCFRLKIIQISNTNDFFFVSECAL
jgi:hypothetical protein